MWIPSISSALVYPSSISCMISFSVVGVPVCTALLVYSSFPEFAIRCKYFCVVVRCL